MRNLTWLGRYITPRHWKGQDGNEAGPTDYIIVLLGGDQEEGCQGAGFPEDLQHVYQYVTDNLFR